jgi:hypothetical protein
MRRKDCRNVKNERRVRLAKGLQKENVKKRKEGRV